MAKKMIAIRIDEEKKRELDILLAKRGIKLQQFLEEYIDQELEKEKSDIKKTDPQ